MRERRRFNRVQEPLELLYRPSGELAASWHKAILVNISAGGLRFRSDEAVESGTLLELQIQLPGSRQPATIRGLVIWTQMPAAGVTESGVEFSDTDPEKLAEIDDVVEFLRTTGGPSS